MLSPFNYLKAINLRHKLEKAVKLQQAAGLRVSVRIQAELNWTRHVIATHLAARAAKSQFMYA